MKKFLCVLLTLAMALSLTACGGDKTNTSDNTKTPPSSSDNSSGSGYSGDKMTLRAADNMADDFQWNVNLRMFADLVAQRTDGKVTIEIYPNSELGDDQALAEMIRSGNLDIQVTGSGVPGRWFEELSIAEMPYLFKSLDHVERATTGDNFKWMQDKLLEYDFYLLANWNRASRQILSNKKIENLADFAGMKIRVPETDNMVTSFKALGANPTPLAYSEVFTSLQQKVIDAVENPLSSMYTMRFHETTKYLAITNHCFSFSVVLMSPKTWNSLTPELQNILTECMAEVTAYNNEVTATEDQGFIDKMVDETGIEVTYPDIVPKTVLWIWWEERRILRMALFAAWEILTAVFRKMDFACCERYALRLSMGRKLMRQRLPQFIVTKACSEILPPNAFSRSSRKCSAALALRRS